jgi:hypothetical protein
MSSDLRESRESMCFWTQIMQSGLLICFVVVGAAAYGQSPSSNPAQVKPLNQYTSSVSCSFSPQSITPGGSTNFTVSVSCASNVYGGVNVYAGSNGVCGASLPYPGSSSVQVSCSGGSSLAAGSYSITASYGGDQYCSSATSSSCGTLTVQSKITPTVSAWPTASAITWGQSLASSTLSGGTASVGGTFAWTTPSTIPPAGAQSESVTFTPTDTTHYNTVTGSTTASVNALTLSSPTSNAGKGIYLQIGGGPALVPLGNGLYSNALELVYVNPSQDVALAYSTDGLNYTNVGPISVPGHNGNVAQLDCTPAYSDHCGVAAAAHSGLLYVAYNDVSCNCLHVLRGTPVSGQAVFTWTDVYADTAHVLVTTPAMLWVPNGPYYNLIVRYGTTSGTHEAYSSVLNGSNGGWTTRDSNSTSRTQSTLFTIDGAIYAIDLSNPDYSGQMNITELDTNGVAISSTTYPIQYVSGNITQGFSSTVYSGFGNCVFVASMPPASNILQILSTSDYYGSFAHGEFWGPQTYSNIQVVPYNGFSGDFAMTVYPPQPSGSAKIVVVYRGDSSADLYAASGTPAPCNF